MRNNALDIFKDKSILITGGTGSFGQAFARRLLTDNQCKKVVIFSRDEWKQWEMRQTDPIFDHPKIRYFLGDVRDATRLMRAFSEIDFIVHAAALKQVPAAEYNPSEFIKTNILGAMNVIDQAINCGVKKVIALSTDKSVNPINLYGATKLCSDRLFVAATSYVGLRDFPRWRSFATAMSWAAAARPPFWRKLIANGAASLPITDKRMTRFWITFDQAVDFVIASFARMRGGEVLVAKIPSMRIEDLAKAIAPQLPHTYSGVREGEKLHELMIGIDDARHTREFADHYMIIPDTYLHKKETLDHFLQGRPGKELPENFCFASDTNKQWLSVDELRDLLAFV